MAVAVAVGSMEGGVWGWGLCRMVGPVERGGEDGNGDGVDMGSA